MKSNTKYWVIFSIISGSALIIYLLSLAGLYYTFSSEEREFGRAIFSKVIVASLIGSVFLFWLTRELLNHLFENYEQIRKLNEEIQLIASANSDYRVEPSSGSKEIQALVQEINNWGEKYSALKEDIENKIQQAQFEVNEEKMRLSALMSQIPNPVLVCNLDGQILLYNQHAQNIFQSEVGDEGSNKREGLIGLGRSIYSIFDRKPIVHALNYLQYYSKGDGSAPVFSFVTSRQGKQFLHVNISFVEKRRVEENHGFLITVEDITERIKSDSKRDVFLQSLTLAMQSSFEKISNAALEIKNQREPLSVSSLKQVNVIDKTTSNLIHIMDQVAQEHTNRLDRNENSENILGEDLINLLYHNIVERFGIIVIVNVQEGLWMNTDSYTTIQGVLYLVGQLTTFFGVETITLDLHELEETTQLKVQWQGPSIDPETARSWMECPLIIGKADTEPVGVGSLLETRGGKIFLNTEGVNGENSVCFNLPKEEPDAKWEKRFVTEKKFKTDNRPVYYAFDLLQESEKESSIDNQKLKRLTYVVFDTETTGLLPSEGDEMISIGAIRIVFGQLLHDEIFNQLINPNRDVPAESTMIHGIRSEMLVDKPKIEQTLPRFYEFSENSILVAHNAAFDMKFLQMKEEQTGIRFNQPVLDTLLLSAVVHPNHELHNLEEIAERLNVPIVGRHTALGDAIVTGEVLLKLLPLLEEQGIYTLGDAIQACKETRFSNIEF